MKIQTLEQLNIETIMSWGPCYDPVEQNILPEDWTGTIVDLLKIEVIPLKDRVWCATRVLSKEILVEFVVSCARRALATVDSPDPRSIKALDATEAYMRGEATLEELIVARNAAYAAAYAAYAAAYAAYAAAYVAAYAAAAYVAAYTAARAAARAAADAAADAVYTAAADAVYTAADAAEWQLQIDWLIERLDK